MCWARVVIMPSCYFDYRINKPFPYSRCVICISCSVHVISTYYVRKGSWAFSTLTTHKSTRSENPTNNRHRPVQVAWEQSVSTAAMLDGRNNTPLRNGLYFHVTFFHCFCHPNMAACKSSISKISRILVGWLWKTHVLKTQSKRRDLKPYYWLKPTMLHFPTALICG